MFKKSSQIFIYNQKRITNIMNKETKITYVNNISVEDYNALRKSVNW